MDQMSAGPFRLIDATGEPRDIWVGEHRLPKVPAPTVIRGRSRLDGHVTVVAGEGAQPIRCIDQAIVVGVVNVPECLPGVLYLVSPRTMAEFPQRDDFVAPSAYFFPDRSRGRRVLVEVTRDPFGGSTAGAVDLNVLLNQ